jgi:hypothetical protein
MADGIYEWSGSPYIPYFGLFGSEHLGVDTPRPDEVGDPGRFLLAVRGAGGTVVGRASRPALRRVPAVTFRRAISANLVEVDD